MADLAAISARYKAIRGSLDERSRRLVAAAEAGRRRRQGGGRKKAQMQGKGSIEDIQAHLRQAQPK